MIGDIRFGFGYKFWHNQTLLSELDIHALQMDRNFYVSSLNEELTSLNSTLNMMHNLFYPISTISPRAIWDSILRNSHVFSRLFGLVLCKRFCLLCSNFERDFNKNGAYMGIYYSYKGNPSTEALSEGTIEKWPSSVWSISDCHAIVL